MRLTLRTLLAYMDDILDPADQEELGRKIESSAFATELIHRSRDAVRRLRLSAPDVLAGESDDLHAGVSNLDANTAAEYLDNTLSPDGVAEFERSCLEAGPHADMLLAEAASCHHVLTMVLGEPAEVDAELRQRMYGIAEKYSTPQRVRIEPAHQTPGLEPAPAPVAVAPPRVSRVDPEAEAPDYILAAAKARRRSQRMKVAAVLGALLLGGGATWLFWPTGEVETPKELAAAGGGNIENLDDLEIGESQPVGDAASTADATAAGAATTDADSQAPAFGAPAESAAPPFTAAPPSEGSAAPLAESSGAVEPPVLPPMADTTPAATVEVEAVEVDVPAVEVALPGEAPATPPAPPAADASASAPPAVPIIPPQSDATTRTPPGATAAPPVEPALPAPPVGEGSVDAAAEMAETPAGVPDAIVDAATSVDETPALDAAPKPIGAYLGSNDDVLLRFDSATSTWVRLPPRSPLTPGDRLLSLPTFRTHVVLGDANVHLAGGAGIEIYAPTTSAAGEAPAEFGVRLPFGRLIINSGLNGNRIEMDLGGDVQTVALAPTSSLAIDVRRVFVPGAGKREAAPAEVEWFLTDGSVERISATGGGEVAAPATWLTGGVITGVEAEVTPTPIDELPEWIDREAMTDSERRAHEKMAESLVSGEPVGIRLLELSDPTGLGRLTELFALAAESGTYVGQFDPVVKALGDVKQRANWPKNIAALRQAIARDPAAVEAIEAAFAAQLGDSAASDLMEMVLGFDAASIGATKTQWQEGALLRLVRWLDSDDLTYRVLASYNLNEITGMRGLGGYRPEQTASQRKSAMAHYWKRLEDGDLKPRGAVAE